MYYRDFLGRIHELLEPPTYLEIGVRNGDSLALARSPSIGIDPAYNLKVAPPPGAKLFPVTSDDFFERAEPLMTFEGRRVGFSFIDGMHLSEFALRDFVNVERHADWTAAIVFDDILPRDIPEANRDRSTHQWTGDVYKVLEALEEHRPDLIILRVGTEPTGLGLVLGVDPDSTVLADRLDDDRRRPGAARPAAGAGRGARAPRRARARRGARRLVLVRPARPARPRRQSATRACRSYALRSSGTSAGR